MNRRRRKKEIIEILDLDDLTSIRVGLRSFRAGDIINPLFSALCSHRERIKWHAVTAFGWYVPLIANEDMEAARVIMRRFLWSLNDESGGIGWGAPEAMAEIMSVDDRLADEYLHMLLSYTQGDGPELFQDGNYLELPMLQRGLLWGVGRLCRVRRLQMQQTKVADDLLTYLASEDEVVKGLAVWCLGLLRYISAKEDILSLHYDNVDILLYLDGDISICNTGELVKFYLKQIENDHITDSAG